MVFIEFKKFGKNRQFWARIPPKNGVFYGFFDPAECFPTLRKIWNVSGKWPDWSKNW
jgi:hypothetical protein